MPKHLYEALNVPIVGLDLGKSLGVVESGVEITGRSVEAYECRKCVTIRGVPDKIVFENLQRLCFAAD